MTALAGLWRFDGRRDAALACERMLSSQQLYGPHAVNQWSDASVALGRRLMRTLPEDAYDRQPLLGGNGHFVLVADIRLDNRDELADVLNIPPAQRRQSCDAAILLAAFERWGERCVERLLGDYAFAVWDNAQRRLVLARDPLGQRPLYYHRANGMIAFASMPKGLHALSEIPYAPDEDRIARSLVRQLPQSGPSTFFRGIERVETGHIVVVTPERLSARRYWEPVPRRINLRSPDEYAEALREQLDRAVLCRLRGTGGIGTHLSGGLDSSAVAATAARLLASADRPLVAFTGAPREGYDGPVPRNRFVDESAHAAATAARYPNVEHVLIREEGRSPLDNLDRNFFLFDQPVHNLCNAVWTHGILDAARERKLSVLLIGLKGNVGLSYHGTQLLPELFRSGRWLRWLRESQAAVSLGGMSWRGVLAKTFGAWCPSPLWSWLIRLNDGHAPDVGTHSPINPRRLAELDPSGEYEADLAGRPAKDAFSARLQTLRRSDQGSANKGVLGGWQIDQRDPTADTRLLEFCLAVPPEQFFSNGVQRALARRALADRLPRVVIEERRRGLQGADWHERLTFVRERIATELDSLGACPPAARSIDLPRLHALVENWPKSDWEQPKVAILYRTALLRAISAGHFLRKASGSNL